MEGVEGTEDSNSGNSEQNGLDFGTLYKKGQNRSSSFSEDSQAECTLPEEHPIRINLPAECLNELARSPLIKHEKDIIENYDIFLNCIFWQVKGIKGRSDTRRSAKNIRNEYAKFKSTEISKNGLGITSKDMKNLDTYSDHDELVWSESVGYVNPNSIVPQPKKSKSRRFPVPKPSSRIRRRNATGPFFARPKLEEMFITKDFEEDFTKGSLIAKGAFGKVYIGEEVNTARKVAIKSTKLKHEPSRIHNIAIEIFLLVSAAHPNVVQHIKSYYWNKQIWSVMEYCSGGALTSLRKVKLNEKQLRFIMQQLILALEHMHKNNIAHRDLKCANILLDINGDTASGKLTSANIKIGDFGLAALITEPKSQTAMCGSRYWMSPEMIQRVGYDTKTDIYSCGCVMFELMTGKAPYRNLGGLLALFNHATKGCEALPPESRNVYSNDCLAFFSRMVTHNQDIRPTAASLLQTTWLWQSDNDPAVLESALNTAYEIPNYSEESKKRDKFKKNTKKTCEN